MAMKIALAQLNYLIGDFEGNLNKMREAVDGAVRDGAGMVLFSELAICGYPPLDLLERKDFVTRCMESIERLAREAPPEVASVGHGEHEMIALPLFSGTRVQAEVHPGEAEELLEGGDLVQQLSAQKASAPGSVDDGDVEAEAHQIQEIPGLHEVRGVL